MDLDKDSVWEMLIVTVDGFENLEKDIMKRIVCKMLLLYNYSQ